MTNQIQSFQFQQQDIQVINKDGEAWFIAAEVAAIFGYLKASDLTRVLDDDEKGTHNMRTLGGKQDVSIISESGLYHAAFKSRKESAKKFRKWVTSEVIPAIRKTGRYEAPRPSTIAERAGIREAVAMLVQKSALDYAEVYRMLHQRFHIEHLEDLSAAQIAEVVEYVHGLVLQAEQTEALPQLTARDYFVSLAKMTGFAQQYHEMQKALSAHNNPGGEFEKIFRGWLAAVPDNKHKDGYLFLFESSIEDDIKQAYTCLKQQSRLLAGAVSC